MVVADYYNLLHVVKATPGRSLAWIWKGGRFFVSLQKVNLKRYKDMSIDDFNNIPLGYAAASLNHVVAVLFPPHPAAVSPAEELGLCCCLNRADRKILNNAFGSWKLIADRRYKIKIR
nr:MAG TPA: hypothetical protein [Caudoviricetes sp.]